jgi:hypothetical protein
MRVVADSRHDASVRLRSLLNPIDAHFACICMAFASVSSEEYQEKKSNSTLCSCFLYATPLPVRRLASRGFFFASLTVN